MIDLDWPALAARLNGDPEFRLAARHWTATLRLDLGARSRRLRFEDGALACQDEAARDAEADLFVRAPDADWEALLAEAPRPFHQDLYGAALHHGVELPADPLAYAAYYPALRRLVQLMGAVHREGRA